MPISRDTYSRILQSNLAALLHRVVVLVFISYTLVSLARLLCLTPLFVITDQVSPFVFVHLLVVLPTWACVMYVLGAALYGSSSRGVSITLTCIAHARVLFFLYGKIPLHAPLKKFTLGPINFRANTNIKASYKKF